jgi:hypothetical protein
MGFTYLSDRLSMHFGVVDHIRASALTTADRRPPSWNRITDSTHASPIGNLDQDIYMYQQFEIFVQFH